jgi:ATP-dependent protease ClpP protease subunit
LFHPISGGLEGTYQEIQAQQKSLDMMNDQLKQIVQKATGIDDKTINKLFEAENYLSSQECLEMGVIHEII